MLFTQESNMPGANRVVTRASDLYVSQLAGPASNKLKPNELRIAHSLLLLETRIFKLMLRWESKKLNDICVI